MMLIRCSFVIIVMVDTIYSASSRSSLKFLPTFGTIHDVLLQDLNFYLDHATFFPALVSRGYMILSSQPPLVHYIYIYICVCVCVHLFSINQFLLLTSFSLFVQLSLLWIYTFTTLDVTTLHVMIIVMPVCMTSYMTTNYEHVNTFKVNLHSQG